MHGVGRQRFQWAGQGKPNREAGATEFSILPDLDAAVVRLHNGAANGKPHAHATLIELQPLARRWMDVSARWMNGDIALLKRWGSMLREQPGLPLPSGMDQALLAYIDQAVQLRLAVLARYISAEQLQRLDKTLDPEWRALGERAERLMADGVPPSAAGARQLAREWQALMDRMVRQDASLRARLRAAYENEPLLQAGTVFTPEAWRYVWRAADLDPDAT